MTQKLVRRLLAGAGLALAAACAEEAPPSEANADASVPSVAQVQGGVERIERGNLVIEGVPDIPVEVSERLRQYANMRGHGFADWADEGVLISTRFGEVSQIHHVRTPGAARRQLTFYDEPINGADVSPAGGAFIFAKDRGGDEFFQGFRQDLTTGDVAPFTEAGTRNGSLIWSDDGAQAAWYRSTGADPDWDIMIGDPADPSSVRVAHEGEGALFPSDWSADGSKLVVQQYISIAKSRIFILNLNDGSFTEFNPDEDVAYSGAALLGDGDILTVTDKGDEFRNLVRFDAESGEAVSYTADIAWDVSSWVVSPDEETVAFAVNEGGLGTIRLLDLEDGTVSEGPD